MLAGATVDFGSAGIIFVRSFGKSRCLTVVTQVVLYFYRSTYASHPFVSPNLLSHPVESNLECVKWEWTAVLTSNVEST